MKPILLLSIFLWLCGASTGRGGALPDSLRHRIDSMIESERGLHAFPGAALVIGDRDTVLYARNYGFHDYSGRNQSVTDEDLFDVASCTKVLSTTFAVMRLYDQGCVRMLDPLEKYLPEWRGTPIGAITLRELLTHTSGMRAQVFYHPLLSNAEEGNLFSGKRSAAYPYEIGKNYYVARSVAFDTLLLSTTPHVGWRQGAAHLYVNPAVDTMICGSILRDFQPSRRGKYLYSDTNLWLMMKIVERVTGQSLASYTRELFSEMDADHTCYNPTEYFDRACCMPTEVDHILGRDTVQGYVHDELGVLSGGVGGNAGLFTTARDVARFCEMLLHKGTYRGRQILTPKTVELFTSSPFAHRGIWRGLGFDKRDPKTSDLGSPHSFGHTGFTGTIFWVDSHKGIYMVFLSNAVHPTRVDSRLNASELRSKIWKSMNETYK